MKINKKVGYPKGKPWSIIRRSVATISFQKTHVKKECIQCNSIFYPFNSEIKKQKKRGCKVQFCSKKCVYLFMKGKKRPLAVCLAISEGRIGMKFSESHKKALKQAYKNGRVNFFLGKKFPQEWKDKMAEAKIGEKNPSWEGGISFLPYPVIFNRALKKKIKERDGYICKHCGKTEKEELTTVKKQLAIHHIDYNKNNCQENNLITVCNSANSLANFNRNYWQDYFNQKLLWLV